MSDPDQTGPAGDRRADSDHRQASGPPQRVITFGHGTLDAGAIVDLLRSARVEEVLDVRRFPGSRRHPHVATERMASWLPDAGIAYRWVEELGGRRRPDSDSPHVGLRNEQFRAYADHMGSEEFAAGLDRLLAAAAERRVAVMCSESVWWRCHRRLLADHLVLLDGVAVQHLFHDGRLQEHPPTPGAVTGDGRVLYLPASPGRRDDARASADRLFDP